MFKKEIKINALGLNKNKVKFLFFFLSSSQKGNFIKHVTYFLIPLFCTCKET